jgi:hypothetical protein
MQRLRIESSEEQQHIAERDSHPLEHARCRLWSFARLLVRAASGRQRLNVLGAWDAVTRELTAVTDTTAVNTETRCEPLRELAAQGLAGSLGIELLYLPPYSPNLNLIERPWRFLKRDALHGCRHTTFADFRDAIQSTSRGNPARTKLPPGPDAFFPGGRRLS